MLPIFGSYRVTARFDVIKNAVAAHAAVFNAGHFFQTIYLFPVKAPNRRRRLRRHKFAQRIGTVIVA